MRRTLEEVEEKVRSAFENAELGDLLVFCRWNCKTEQVCAMCAHVTVREGLSVEDVLLVATAHRA